MDDREQILEWMGDNDVVLRDGTFKALVNLLQAARRTTPDREAIELREAARQFYNMTNGDPMVRISAPSAEKRDAIYDAAKRLRALLELTAPTSDKGGA